MAFRDLALRRLEIGGGLVQGELPEGVRLAIPAKAAGYADAQLDDTHRRRRSEFAWRPPVQMRLRARASHAAPGGTLGFGFWNDPFGFSLGQGGAAARLPAAPDAVWFFYASPPADLRFTPGVAGSGWKAMSLSTRANPLPGIVGDRPYGGAACPAANPSTAHSLNRSPQRSRRGGCPWRQPGHLARLRAGLESRGGRVLCGWKTSCCAAQPAAQRTARFGFVDRQPVRHGHRRVRASASAWWRRPKPSGWRLRSSKSQVTWRIERHYEPAAQRSGWSPARIAQLP